MNLAGLERKSRCHPSAEAAAIAAAIAGARGVDRVAPVIHEGRVIAETFGVPWWIVRDRPDFDPGDVLWRPVTGPRRRAWRPELVPRLRKDAALSTYDNIIAAIQAGQEFDCAWSKAATTAPVANNYYDLWPVGGNPVAGAYSGSAFTARQFDDTTTGALYTFGNVSPSQKRIINASGNSSGGTPTLWVYDRVLTYEACTFNAAANQAFTNTLPAQRYIAGGQSGLKVLVTCQTALGATASNVTQLRYTDQAGNALQSAPVAFANAVIVSAAAPTTTLGARVVYPSVTAATLTVGPFVPLLAGDSGVRLINDWTTSAANTGTLAFVLMNPICQIPIQAAGVTVLLDQVMQITNLEQINDGACISLMAFFPAATGTTLTGNVGTVWG